MHLRFTAFRWRVRMALTALSFSPCRDEFAQPQAGQAVEILPWGAILPNGEKVSELSGHLTTVETGYDPDTRTIQISQAVPGDWVDWVNAPEHAGYLSERDAAGDRRYFTFASGPADLVTPTRPIFSLRLTRR